MEVIKRKAWLRQLFLGLQWPFGFFGAIGVYVWYTNWLGGEHSRLELAIDRHEFGAEQILIFLLELAAPLAFVGAAAFFNWLGGRSGGKVILNDRIVLRGLSKVPDPDFFTPFWRFAASMRERPYALQQFKDEVEKLGAAVSGVKVSDPIKRAACHAAAGVRMCVLAPLLFKEAFGEDAPSEDEVNQRWVEQTIKNYEKIPDFIYRALDPLPEAEWILSVGTHAGECVFLITTLRVFAFEKQKLTHSMDVSSISRFEVVG